MTRTGSIRPSLNKPNTKLSAKFSKFEQPGGISKANSRIEQSKLTNKSTIEAPGNM
jgi:hypothetical protein